MGSAPAATFTGGIVVGRFGGRLSFPFGHLEFDDREILIWGGSNVARATRPNVGAVRLSTGFLSVRVTIIRRDGRPDFPCFTTWSRDGVRAALIEREWPIEETKWAARFS